jgi:S-(hydroxymethyl)glutathione dehydrogenase/alcohol dehydrogenase
VKAAVVEQLGGTFQVTNVELGLVGPHEVLVKVKASGLCHSDPHLSRTPVGLPFPVVFGHEMAGIVEEIGSEVTDFEVGDHVVGCPITFCGHCVDCLDGRTYECNHGDELSRPADEPQRITRAGMNLVQFEGLGGFAERSIVHRNQLAKVNKAIPFPQAAILGCATVTGAGAAINAARVRPGDTVAVIGAGGVGLNVISGARIAGATTIIAIDILPGKLELAKRFGATHTINAADLDPVAAVKAATGHGVNHAFEVIGLKKTAEQALAMLAKGGGAYLIGLLGPGEMIEVEGTADMILNQKKLQGVHLGAGNFKKDIPNYAELYLAGRLNLDDLISEEISLRDINAGYEAVERGTVTRSIITSFE